jgi:hypothetical protein
MKIERNESYIIYLGINRNDESFCCENMDFQGKYFLLIGIAK